MGMKRMSARRFIRAYGNCYAFVLPFFVLFGIFGIYPMFYSLYLSFVNWTPKKMTFIGLENFRKLISDPVFWISIKNTLYLLVINVPLMTFLAVIFAYMFNDSRFKGRRVYQLIYLLPYVTSTVAISIVFIILFDDANGWVNVFLNRVGLPSVKWLRSEGVAMWTYNILTIWQWVGYNMLILLGGLQSIDCTLYEAAYIDGSTRVKNMIYITIPHLMPVIWFCLIMSTIGTFNSFVPSKVLFSPAGGPGYATYTVTFYQYLQTFQNFRLGYGATIAFAILIFIAVLSIPQVIRAIKER